VWVFTLFLFATLACTIFAPLPVSVSTAVVVVTRVVPLTPTPPVPVATGSAAQTVITSSEEQALIELYQRVNPSVVAILVETAAGGGQGSGFVYDLEGHIVTNHHVVEDSQSIEVDFSSGLKVRGRVLGSDPDSDLAVVEVDVPADQLIPVALGDSDQVRVGQRVVAIGNPFGLAGTMTVGIISGLGRTVDSTRVSAVGGFSAPDIIQTDAAINPGNSGGPLINLLGEVIGVNKAIEPSDFGANSGVGFAVASNTVRQIAPYLIEDGAFVYPYLGISSLDDISLSLQEELNLPQTRGAYVTSIVAGGPAARSGLRGDASSDCGNFGNCAGGGDLIVAIDGSEVDVFSDVLSYLVNHARPGQEVTLTVLREGQTAEVKVVLGERP
jgi:2-alkenal reductase